MVQQVFAVGRIVAHLIDLIFENNETCRSILLGVSDYDQSTISHILFRARNAVDQKPERIVRAEMLAGDPYSQIAMSGERDIQGRPLFSDFRFAIA